METYKQLGAKVEECSLDIAEYALATYYIIACAETSSNLGRFDGIRYGYRAKDFTNLKELYRKSRTEACGVDKNGMPVGMQLIGDRFSEAKLLNAAYTFEQKIQFKQNHKPEFKK